MKINFKSSKGTRYASYVLVVVFALYALTAIGMTGLLFSSAVGLVAFGITESVEATAVVLVLAGILFKVVRPVEGFMSSDPKKIGARVKAMKKGSGAGSGASPQGVLSSSYAEGFEDAKMPEDEGFETASGEKVTPDLTGAIDAIKAAVAEKPAAAQSAPASTKEAFKSDNKGLFKLGEIPTDESGGYHIDQGTTVLNALNALKPDQIKSMTDDTQKLIDTQKSLMGLLGTMKPMMQDGKQLLETFNTMFK